MAGGEVAAMVVDRVNFTLWEPPPTGSEGYALWAFRNSASMIEALPLGSECLKEVCQG